MSLGTEQITLIEPEGRKFPGATFSSSGQANCQLTDVRTWKCTIDLIDTEDVVNEIIEAFAPQQDTLAKKLEVCDRDTTKTECQNLKKINEQLLSSYCQRIATFPSGFTNGQCPNYPVNPFNPLYPGSQGCSKMVVAQGVCEEWIASNFEGGVPSYPNGSIQNYCAKTLTPDCACQSAPESAIFKLVAEQGVGGARCWWKPCTLQSEGNYLVRKGDVPAVCSKTICVNVANVFLQNDEIGKSVIINETSTCGSDNGNTVWYKQWWFWIIALALVVILFAIVIYFVNKL